ncbi:MAG TPA: 4,5-DOPA dioxygenase extradiol [Cytophagales bacterium]|nr:4,5-DOPA dioxygenase extradiol [Cytophagales bacterium]HCR53903.1 4,5-DOPA dioxygenase extradiol [Cytophagales bacterium]
MNLRQLTDPFKPTEKFPALFLGHGSPMNAIEENGFVKGWKKTGEHLPKPNAILCISAHWETNGTLVTAMESPKTIHDFYGFPKSLFDVQYPAPGSPELATVTRQTIQSTEVAMDYEWGLDHGSWSVVRHLYPQANIPIIQMSLDRTQPAAYHYQLAQELNALRRRGVLIIGSGNMVHNLRVIDWKKPHEGYEWAIAASEKMQKLMLDRDHKALVDYRLGGKEMELSIPTPEHYLPLLYILALQEKNETLSLFNNKTIMGSISMTSVQIGDTIT